MYVTERCVGNDIIIALLHAINLRLVTNPITTIEQKLTNFDHSFKVHPDNLTNALHIDNRKGSPHLRHYTDPHLSPSFCIIHPSIPAHQDDTATRFPANPKPLKAPRHHLSPQTYSPFHIYSPSHKYDQDPSVRWSDLDLHSSCLLGLQGTKYSL